MEESQSREPQITRRALTRGVAWSAPVIASSISFSSSHQTGQSSHTITATSADVTASVTTRRSGSIYSCSVS